VKANIGATGVDANRTGCAPRLARIALGVITFITIAADSSVVVVVQPGAWREAVQNACGLRRGSRAIQINVIGCNDQMGNRHGASDKCEATRTLANGSRPAAGAQYVIIRHMGWKPVSCLVAAVCSVPLCV
jgi:hypothetical protein